MSLVVRKWSIFINYLTLWKSNYFRCSVFRRNARAIHVVYRTIERNSCQASGKRQNYLAQNYSVYYRNSNMCVAATSAHAETLHCWGYYLFIYSWHGLLLQHRSYEPVVKSVYRSLLRHWKRYGLADLLGNACCRINRNICQATLLRLKNWWRQWSK